MSVSKDKGVQQAEDSATVAKKIAAMSSISGVDFLISFVSFLRWVSFTFTSYHPCQFIVIIIIIIIIIIITLFFSSLTSSLFRSTLKKYLLVPQILPITDSSAPAGWISLTPQLSLIFSAPH